MKNHKSYDRDAETSHLPKRPSLGGILGFGRVTRRLLLPFALTCVLNTGWYLEAEAEEKPRLAVIPFFVIKVEDPGRGAVCPVCKGIYQRGDILPGSRDTLTRLLFQKMEGMGTFSILPPEKVEEALSPDEKRQMEEKPLPSSIRIGKELNADFIFIDFLFRFVERVGSPMGVEKPASVGFDVHLVRLRDGKEVWKGKFDETQQPLSENLLKIGSFFRRKASWLTAEELASVGMEEMFKRFPSSKELEE